MRLRAGPASVRGFFLRHLSLELKLYLKDKPTSRHRYGLAGIFQGMTSRRSVPTSKGWTRPWEKEVTFRV